MTDRAITVHARAERIDEIIEPAYAPYARLRELVEPGTTVLDVGCGNGKVGAYLTEAGAVVDGIEPADSRVDIAKSRLRYVSEQWAGPDFNDPLIRPKYDLVTFLDVVEHIPDPLPVLEWAATRLAPGGAICLLIPNSAHWSFRVKMLRGDWRYRDWGLFDRTHLRFFDPETASALRPTVLTESRRSYSSFGRGPQAAIVSIRPRLLAMHIFFEWRLGGLDPG